MGEMVRIDEQLIAAAEELTGIQEHELLVSRALRELIHREASRRLAIMGGSLPDAWAPNEGEPSPE